MIILKLKKAFEKKNESSKYWLSVLTEIRNRGTEDILIISIDNLKGFFEA